MTITAADKLAIIIEVEQFWNTQTLRKHNLLKYVDPRWQNKFLEAGVSLLESYSSECNPELYEAKKQHCLLKNEVA